MKFAKPPISVEPVAFETMRFTPFTSILRVAELFAPCGHPRYCYFQNTLQASPTVRRHDAQTGGFIFLRKALRDNRLKNPDDYFVGCGEVRTASVREMMRFAMFTASYGLRGQL
jgi:hypothetical protein